MNNIESLNIVIVWPSLLCNETVTLSLITICLKWLLRLTNFISKR
jgi:hypothetical protein